MRIRPLKGQEYKSVLDHGTRNRVGDLIFYRHRDGDGIPAFGLSVGRKFGKAVQRNKIKRQLRSLFKENADLFDSGDKIVVIVRPPVNNYTFQEIKHIFDSQFAKA